MSNVLYRKPYPFPLEEEKLNYSVALLIKAIKSANDVLDNIIKLPNDDYKNKLYLTAFNAVSLYEKELFQKRNLLKRYHPKVGDVICMPINVVYPEKYDCNNCGNCRNCDPFLDFKEYFETDYQDDELCNVVVSKIRYDKDNIPFVCLKGSLMEVPLSYRK